ncbi:hypothetical protein HJC23_010886 [Cyclotella cryptica]|uniref:Uncharacterized protein n=1 Tax=Cyclotella cryptica TaxID=29204 RepID=A0ABD3NTW6_9STRA|eukprot:CCRYP_019765-RA/>CCRYP_019765-RA protein AED:0.35 eAED:0.35 QI:0/-1/0/1/-1/1/1/0/556
MLLVFVSFLALCLTARGYTLTPPLSSFKHRRLLSKHNSAVLSSSPCRMLLYAISQDGSAEEWHDINDSSTIMYNDFEQDITSSAPVQLISESSSPTKPNSNPTAEQSLTQLLRKRTSELLQSSRRLLKNWKTGKAKSYGAFSINEQFFMNKEERLPFDWVRRVAIGRYPRVACGSAHGSIFVADVNARQLLCVASGVHYSDDSNDFVNALDEQLRQYIYGDYDGGGVLAVAMFGKGIIASSGREGGVKLFKLFEDTKGTTELIYQGDVQSLIRPMPGALPVIVTCMKFDSIGRLYLGGSDGFLRIVSFPEDYILGEAYLDSKDLKVTIISPSTQDGRPPSPILSLDISEQLEMVVTAHGNGNVCLYSVKEEDNRYSLSGELAGVWNPFAKSRKTYARSVIFASMERKRVLRHAVVVGAGNGEVWINDIHPAVNVSSYYTDVVNEFADRTGAPLLVNERALQFQPSHVGPVISLASRPGGIVVSAGHDGMLRITQTWIGQENLKDAPRKDPMPLYGLGGYRVWIGSVCVDEEGKRLVSDGMDDAVVVHDFSYDESIK